MVMRPFQLWPKQTVDQTKQQQLNQKMMNAVPMPIWALLWTSLVYQLFSHYEKSRKSTCRTLHEQPIFALFWKEKKKKNNEKEIMMRRKSHNSRHRFKYNDDACMFELLSSLRYQNKEVINSNCLKSNNSIH